MENFKRLRKKAWKVIESVQKLKRASTLSEAIIVCKQALVAILADVIFSGFQFDSLSSLFVFVIIIMMMMMMMMIIIIIIAPAGISLRRRNPEEAS